MEKVRAREGEEEASKKVKRNGATIVMPVFGEKLSAHFGHCEQFAFVETENGTIKWIEMRTSPPHEPGVLPRWLVEQGANVVIAAGIGAQAQQVLKDNGIEVIAGAPMHSLEYLANQYLSNSLITGENVCDH